jgi:hypothetical protein
MTGFGIFLLPFHWFKLAYGARGFNPQILTVFDPDPAEVLNAA